MLQNSDTPFRPPVKACPPHWKKQRFSRQLGDILIADQHPALIDHLQIGNHPQGSGLATA
jgi:hypothetical protein